MLRLYLSFVFGRTVSACIRSISLASRKQRNRQWKDLERSPLRSQRCRFFASLRASVSNLKRYNPRSHFYSSSYHKASSSNNKHHLFQIIQIITVFKTYESLSKSNIEGIEVLARQFHTISMNVKRKQYDMLAPRTAEFETDFAKFMTQVSHIEVCILSCFSKSANCSGIDSPYFQSPYLYSALFLKYGRIRLFATLIYRTSCGHL